MTRELLEQNPNNLHFSQLNSSPTEIEIAIKSIRRDGDTQSRVAIERTAVREYASLMREGNKFPPVLLFFDGTDYWLADGFHRVEAALSIGLERITASISEGTRRDAMLYSVGANAVHGLRRTSADKQRAVMTLLQDREWSRWSDREIARRCGVHHQMVGKLRSSLDESSSERTYTTKHGTIAKMKTARASKETQTEGDLTDISDSLSDVNNSETMDYLHSGREDDCSDSTEMLTPLMKVRENISGLCASLCKSVEHLSLAQAQLIAKALNRRWSLEELLRS
jgi:hypothetical protein